MDERNAELCAGAEDDGARAVAVERVEHHVRAVERGFAVFFVQEEIQRFHLDRRVHGPYAARRGFRLRLAEVLLRRVKLTVQVVLAERVAVRKNELPDPGAREDLDYPPAEPAAAGDRGARLEQPRLTIEADSPDAALVPRRAEPRAQRRGFRLARGHSAAPRGFAAGRERHDAKAVLHGGRPAHKFDGIFKSHRNTSDFG